MLSQITPTTGTAARVNSARAGIFHKSTSDLTDRQRFIGRPFAAPFKISPFHGGY